MRLATILPHAARAAAAVPAAPDGRWVPLDAIAAGPVARLEDALPSLLLPGTEAAARIVAWRGTRWREDQLSFLPPIVRPPAFRDFYAFEQHVKTARARRGLEMPPAWYEVPVFYFSNHNGLIGHEAPVSAPVGSIELDYELELGVVIGRG